MAVLPPIKWSRYIPSDRKPTPKQYAFLWLPHREAMYGGAASGGKTEALCMDALRWMDVPGFSGVIFRRKITDHLLKKSCLNRILQWVDPYLRSGEMKYNGNEHTLYSQEGGMLTFGYLDKEGSKERYQSAEYHLVIFDELTHFKDDQYLYLFSRQRREVTHKHIPVRMRSGTNPGGIGHAWVKKRFKIEKDEDGEFRGHHPNRPFIQAKVGDNPHVDQKAYLENLAELPELERFRLRDGDWSASGKSIYRDTWFENRWTKKGEYFNLTNKDGSRTFHESQIFIFATTDVAGSEYSGVEDKTFFENRSPSWSVFAVWGLTPDNELLWLENNRYQCTIPNFIHKSVEICQRWKPVVIGAEDNSINLGYIQACISRGLPMQPVHQVTDKITRSYSGQILAEQGHIWLPVYAEWLQDVEDELFVWEGCKFTPDDIIDVLSLAGSYTANKRQGMDWSPGVRSGIWSHKPSYTSGLFGTQLATLGKRGAREGLFPVRRRTG